MQDTEVEALVLKGICVLRGSGTLLGWGEGRIRDPQKGMHRSTARQQERLLDEVALEDFRRLRKLDSVPAVKGMS